MLLAGYSAGSFLVTCKRLQFYNNVFNLRLLCSTRILSCLIVCTGQLGWNLRTERNQDNHPGFVGLHHGGGGFQILDARQSDFDHVPGRGLHHDEIGPILRRIEHWHQGSVTSFRILYQDAAGLGDEVKWDGEKAEAVAPR